MEEQLVSLEVARLLNRTKLLALQTNSYLTYEEALEEGLKQSLKFI